MSLAFNAAPELREFLERVPLKYAAVLDCEKYPHESLKIAGYPTHIIVGRDGRIVKMAGTVDDLAPALAHELPANPAPKALAAK